MNSKSLCFPAVQPILNHVFNFAYHSLVSHNTRLTFSYETTCWQRCRTQYCQHVIYYENVKLSFRPMCYFSWRCKSWHSYVYSTRSFVGQDGAVSIMTTYRMDGPRIDFQWGRDFPHLSRPTLGTTQPSTREAPVISGGKASGTWLLPPTLTRPEVKEGIDMYFNSPSAPSWKVVGWIVTLDVAVPLYISQ